MQIDKDNVALQTQPISNGSQVKGVECLVDLSYLKEFSANDLDFEKEIIQSSIEEFDEKIIELQLSYGKLDLLSINKITHSLKSLSSIIGSAGLHNYFNTIETSCTFLAYDELQSLFCKAQALWVKVKAALQVIMAGQAHS